MSSYDTSLDTLVAASPRVPLRAVNNLDYEVDFDIIPGFEPDCDAIAVSNEEFERAMAMTESFMADFESLSIGYPPRSGGEEPLVRSDDTLINDLIISFGGKPDAAVLAPAVICDQSSAADEQECFVGPLKIGEFRLNHVNVCTPEMLIPPTSYNGVNAPLEDFIILHDADLLGFDQEIGPMAIRTLASYASGEHRTATLPYVNARPTVGLLGKSYATYEFFIGTYGRHRHVDLRFAERYPNGDPVVAVFRGGTIIRGWWVWDVGFVGHEILSYAHLKTHMLRWQFTIVKAWSSDFGAAPCVEPGYMTDSESEEDENHR